MNRRLFALSQLPLMSSTAAPVAISRRKRSAKTALAVGSIEEDASSTKKMKIEVRVTESKVFIPQRLDLVARELPFFEQFLALEAEMCEELASFMSCKAKGITHVYNPLIYARETHRDYVQKYCTGAKQVLFIGMNPGPFGMAQNGVPFGETSIVKDWLKISGAVQKPPKENAHRPIDGLKCVKSEVSGARLWGLIRRLSCGDPENFFRNGFVHNYCPLVFMTSSGKNVTPAELPAAEKEKLKAVCSKYLCKTLVLLKPKFVVAVGKFVLDECTAAVTQVGSDHFDFEFKLAHILHPSPACPAANGGKWDGTVLGQLAEIGCIDLLKGV